MQIKQHEHHLPGNVNVVRVITEVEHRIAIDCGTKDIQKTKEDMYEETIERMRLEVERYDEIKLRQEAEQNEMATRRHLRGITPSAIAFASGLVCFWMGMLFTVAKN